MSFRHAYMVLATDFELEPVIEQYLATYPEAQPRKYDVVCRLQNERQEGDYCYIVVYEHSSPRFRPELQDYLKACCRLNRKVANVTVRSSVFPEIPRSRSQSTSSGKPE